MLGNFRTGGLSLGAFRTGYIGFILSILFLVAAAATQAQTIVTNGSNNLTISEVQYETGATAATYTQTVSGAAFPVTPPNNSTVLISQLTINGFVYEVESSFPTISNISSRIGSLDVPIDGIRIFLPGTVIPHRNGSGVNPAYVSAMPNVIGSTDLRSYFDLSSTALDGTDFLDAMYQDPVLPGDVLIIAERNGNTPIQFTPLGADGEPISGYSVVQTGVGGGSYQWNTTISNPLDSNSNQKLWLLAFNAGLFYGGNQSGPPVYGWRINDINQGADFKVLLFRSAPPVAKDIARLGNPAGAAVTLDIVASAADGRLIDPTSVALIDPDTGASVTLLEVDGEGSWSVDPDTGAITFTPEPGFEGDPTPVSYTVDDDQGTPSNPATVTVGYLQLPSIAITKTADVTDTLPMVGEDITYTITVENTGNVTLSDVRVSDPLVDLDVTLATLAPGATQIFIETYTVTLADFIAAQIVNTARVEARAPDGTIIEAEATLAVPEMPGSISGTVFLDRDGNGSLDAGDLRLEGYTVELRDSNGTILATEVTDNLGFYEFDPVVSGYEYTVVFRRPDGAIIGTIAVSVGEGEGVTNVNLPIDPAGVVYDSVTRAPLAGVTLVLTDIAGTPLPPICMGPGQQSQVTGPSGAYQFDVFPGSDFACPVELTEYRLVVLDAPAGYSTGPSVVLPPQGPLEPPTGAGVYEVVSFSRAPMIGEATIYHLAFLLQGGPSPSFDVINNHIPLDGLAALPAPGDLEITKTAGVSSVRIGDLLNYQISITNNGAADSVIDVVDTLPAGFVYRGGSGAIDGISVTPAQSGQTLRFGQVTVPAGGVTNITLTTFISSSVAVGTHINRAQMLNAFTGVPIGPEATAAVRVEADPVFQCSTVIGRVFDDINHDGYFNGEQREERLAISDQNSISGKGKFWSEPASVAPGHEKGLPGVRLVTPNGIAVTTDEHGRFSLPCAALPRDIGSNFMLKLDDRTLPVGYRLTTENPRVVRLTPGMLTKMNFGAAMFPVARVDLSAGAFTASGEMGPELRTGLQGLVAQIAARPSVVRLSYQLATDERDTVGNARLRSIEREIRHLWSGTGRYALTVERVVERPAQESGRQ